jgi:hypothetical protein
MIPVLNGKPRVTAGPGSSKGPAAAAKNSAAAKNPVPQAQNSAAGVQAAAGELSVEQALAARELIAAQAQNQLAKMEHIADQDPEAVDPDVLAEQIALAERAAVLNKRALAKQKLAEQNGRPTAAKTDPTAANNLAMVTPLEFVKVPGVDRPVMKPPTTSFVPVATPSPQQPATGKSSGRAGRSGRRGVLARAEAAARAATGNRRAARPDPVSTADPLPTAAFATVSASEQAEPPRVAARSAYGLEPLDAATAGLGRAQRSRLLQLGVLALGITALIAGIIMIISGLTR